VPDPPGGCRPTRPIDQVWQPGYDIQMAIGQGDLTVSPMQLAVAYSAIANGGKLVTPHVGKALTRQPATCISGYPARSATAPVPELLARDPPGLYEASHAPRHVELGVRHASSRRWPARPAPPSTRRHPPPNAWFASMRAPSRQPKLVVVALINDGGHGGVVGGAGGAQVYQAFFHPQKITTRVGSERPPADALLPPTPRLHADGHGACDHVFGLWILRNATRNGHPR
jgi:penicillin-binding protein 2